MCTACNSAEHCSRKEVSDAFSRADVHSEESEFEIDKQA